MNNTARILSSVGLMTLITILPSQSFASPPENGAVMCDKCKMVMVKVANPTTAKNPTISYHNAQTMECPDCKSAMVNFFKTLVMVGLVGVAL